MSELILDIDLQNLTNIEKQSNYFLKYNTSANFKHDKVNYQDDCHFLILDGMVLNKKKLLEDDAQSNWPQYLIREYQKRGNHFFDVMRGSFYGFLYDKQKNKWVIFSDHISSKPLYFAEYKNHICFANNYVELVNYLKQKNRKVTLNEQAAYLLLTYGYVFEDITITNEIKRLMVGYSAVIDNGKLRVEKFYTLKNNPTEISEEDAIEEIDKKFKKVVQRAFEKDREYGYKHVATLSGGLDSRMTVWVAHKLGFTNQLNITFSQSDYLDESVAKQIAADLKHEWLFKALDNGNFLKNIDETTKLTGGNVLYYGLAHQMSLYQYINFNDLGILHSGQLGDVVLSTFYSSLNPNKQYKFGDGAYSSELLSAVSGIKFKEDYPNEEIFKMYIRGFYGANQGLLCGMKYSETFSPFYDVDFMQFALSIPLKLRFNHHLYKKWIIKKYPEAAKYIWEKEKVPVNYHFWIYIMGRQIPLKQIPHKILSRFGYRKYGINSKNHMNPLEYWYQTNSQLKNYMDCYYRENIHMLDTWPQLKAHCERLYLKTKGSEKIQVLSLLGCAKCLL